LPASDSLRVTFDPDGLCAGQDPRRRAVRAGEGQQRTGQRRSSWCRTTARPWRPAARGARTSLLS
jgi:hypothetical protein